MNTIQPTAAKRPEAERPHALSLKDRGTLILSGVLDVVSFDEREIVLNTSLGALTVEGEGLHITKLSLESGEVSAEGRVSAIFYADRTEKVGGGRLRRLLG